MSDLTIRRVIRKQVVEEIHFGGITFRRYPESKASSGRNYFVPNGKHRKNGVGRLHEEIWKAANGPIPAGCEIHHRDRNPSNNDLSNLECLTEAQHKDFHRHDVRPQMQTAAWLAHLARARTLARPAIAALVGSEINKERSERAFRTRKPKFYTCEECGKVLETKSVTPVRFCSSSCAQMDRRRSKVDNEDRTCVTCGKVFNVNRYRKTKTCSRACGRLLAAAQKITVTCVQCGIEFESVSVGKEKKFCSHKCNSTHRRHSGIDDIEATCQMCGKSFMTRKYAPNKTCSKQCGQQLRFKGE